MYKYRIHTLNYDFAIYSADFNNLGSLTKEKFNSELCRLIPKVTKQKGEVSIPRLHIISNDWCNSEKLVC